MSVMSNGMAATETAETAAETAPALTAALTPSIDKKKISMNNTSSVSSTPSVSSKKRSNNVGAGAGAAAIGLVSISRSKHQKKGRQQQAVFVLPISLAAYASHALAVAVAVAVTVMLLIAGYSYSRQQPLNNSTLAFNLNLAYFFKTSPNSSASISGAQRSPPQQSQSTPSDVQSQQYATLSSPTPTTLSSISQSVSSQSLSSQSVSQSLSSQSLSNDEDNAPPRTATATDTATDTAPVVGTSPDDSSSDRHRRSHFADSLNTHRFSPHAHAGHDTVTTMKEQDVDLLTSYVWLNRDETVTIGSMHSSVSVSGTVRRGVHMGSVDNLGSTDFSMLAEALFPLVLYEEGNYDGNAKEGRSDVLADISARNRELSTFLAEINIPSTSPIPAMNQYFWLKDGVLVKDSAKVVVQGRKGSSGNQDNRPENRDNSSGNQEKKKIKPQIKHTPMTGKLGAELSIVGSLIPRKQALFTCLFKNGTDIFLVARTIVRISSKPVSNTRPSYAMQELGSQLYIGLLVESSPPPSFQWYKNGFPIPGEDRQNFIVKSVKKTDEGTYSCKIWNVAGEFTWKESVVVII